MEIIKRKSRYEFHWCVCAILLHVYPAREMDISLWLNSLHIEHLPNAAPIEISLAFCLELFLQLDSTLFTFFARDFGLPKRLREKKKTTEEEMNSVQSKYRLCERVWRIKRRRKKRGDVDTVAWVAHELYLICMLMLIATGLNLPNRSDRLC